MKKLIYTLFLIIFVITDVKALCSNEMQYELNVASSNVTMDYVIDTLVIDSNNVFHPEIPVDQIEVHETSEYTLVDKMTLKIENVSDKIYIVLRCLEEDINQVFHYEDLDNGSFVYEIPNFDIIRHFELTVYSNENECLDQELRKIEVVTPKYNEYADYAICDNNNNYYCREYVTTEVNLDKEIENFNYFDQIEQDDDNVINENVNENKQHWVILLVIITITLLILILVIVIVYLLIKKRRKEKIMKSIGGN